MDVLKSTNEELFDFSDLPHNIDEEIEMEELRKKFEAEFPHALGYLLGDQNKLGKYFKLQDKFDQKFDFVEFEPVILSLAVMGMLENGWSPDDIVAEVCDTIDSNIAANDHR